MATASASLLSAILRISITILRKRVEPDSLPPLCCTLSLDRLLVGTLGSKFRRDGTGRAYSLSQELGAREEAPRPEQ